MYGPGLKSHITVTLMLLLGVAMVLAYMVIVFFWQQTIIKAEAERILTTLQLTSQNSTPRQLYAQLTGSLAPECLSIQLPDRKKIAFDSNCTTIPEVDKAILRTSQTGSPTAMTAGSTWAVFSLQPKYVIVALPIQNEMFTGSVAAASSLSPMYRALRKKQKIIAAYLLVNIILLTVVGFFRLAKSTIKPVERLVRMTEEYDESYDVPPFSIREGNEFGQLNSSLNSMTQRIEKDRRQLRQTVLSLETANRQLQQTQKEMIKAEKLAAVGRLSAGLAHEIGNPIGIIQGYLELLQKSSLAKEERLQYSQRAIDELNRINQLIRQLLDFARSSPAEYKKVGINSLIQDVVDVFRARKNLGNISFHFAPDAKADTVFADEEGLRQVFLNCLINSVDAIAENGTDKPGAIYITTKTKGDKDKPEMIVVSIKDNGTGIDPAFIDTIFDPFFTTKEPGKGTGLGLSVSHTIIEAAGGTFAARSTEGEQTELRITLPLQKNDNVSTRQQSEKLNDQHA